MFTMNTNTVLISLISVFVGWFLGQGSELIKNWVTTFRLKKSLLIELEDVRDELRRTAAIYERKLQIYSLSGIEPSVPLPLSHYFFQNYYKDVLNKLNREQRLSYQIIHAHVSSLNEGFLELSKITAECCNVAKHRVAEGPRSSPVAKWGDYVIAQYKNVMDTIWHIDHHLRNPNKPDLSLFEKTHDNYVKFTDDINKRVAEIIQKAKKLKRENFEVF